MKLAKTVQGSWKARVQAATVHLPKRVGQGVLVPGGFVITAAHCVDSYNTGGMALGDHCVERVETKDGAGFLLSIYAVEPVSDIAVLGAPDNQVLFDDAEAFEAFCDRTPGVPICARDLGAGRFPIHLLSHRGGWTTGTASEPGVRVGSGAWIRVTRKIEGGTSGGPVLTEAGELVGVVSGGTFDGFIPRPHRALPGWLWAQIEGAQRDILEAERQAPTRTSGSKTSRHASRAEA